MCPTMMPIRTPASRRLRALIESSGTHLDIHTRSQPPPIARVVHSRQETKREIRSEVVRSVREALEDNAQTVA